ncbi:MAG: hypothetical protein ACRD20_10880 [Terriglobales bacterium]
MIIIRIVVIVCVLLSSGLLAAQGVSPREKSATRTAVNQDSLTIQDFSTRVDDYAKLRKRAQAGLSVPKSGSSAADIRQYQLSLAQKIREERPRAKAGDVFTAPVSRIFRKLIAAPFQSREGSKIRASLLHGEPVRGFTLEVNRGYPQTSALQSTPPSLLIDLPKLPAELEYRIVGRELILLDAAANLIVDLLPDALPPLQAGRR